MLKVHFFSLCLTLMIVGTVHAQARSIDKIVDKSTLEDEEIKKIEGYAVYWTDALATSDGEELNNARKKLAEPLEPDVEMSVFARSIYGDALRESAKQYLSNDSTSEMAAVNTLQVISLLGTDQGCSVLLTHANSLSEDRDALRLWASIGLNNSFQIGLLDARRVSSIAKLVAGFMTREQDWYILARQFDTISSIKNMPGSDTQEQEELEQLSFQLQANALVDLLNRIQEDGTGQKLVKVLPVVLPALMLEFVEHGVDAGVKEDAKELIMPSLISFVEHASSLDPTSEQGAPLNKIYGNAVGNAAQLIRLLLGETTEPDVTIGELWGNNNMQAIQERVAAWNTLLKN